MTYSDKRTLVAFLGIMQHSRDYSQRKMADYRKIAATVENDLDRDLANRMKARYSPNSSAEEFIEDFMELYAEELGELSNGE